MQKPPKKTQKSPHPFGHLPASYRPAIGQLQKTEDTFVTYRKAESQSNLRRIYAEPTPNLHRIYVEPTSGTIGKVQDIFLLRLFRNELFVTTFSQ